LPIASFSRCQWAFIPDDCSRRSAISFSTLASRSFEGLSDSFLSASRLRIEIDRLVGQEAVGDVAVRERRRGDERRVLDAHAVVHLVALLEPAQNPDRLLDARLVHVDRLKAPRQGGVLLDVLLVLVERRRAHAAQLAAREHGLQHVRGVHRALGGAGADDRVQLVDEQHHLALRFGDLLEHGLQAVLELAAVLGPGDQGAEVERDHALVLERLGDVPLHDALRQTLDDRGLADARLADQHGVVLGAAREHLYHAAHLVVAADHGIELALARGLGEVAAVALERLVAVLGVGVVDALVPPDLLEHAQQRVAGDAGAPQHLGRGRLRVDEREQQVLGRDVLVLERLGLAQRLLEDAIELRRDARGRALGPRERRERAIDLGQDGPGIRAELTERGGDDPTLLAEKRLKKLLGRDLGPVGLLGLGLRRKDGLLSLHRELVESHVPRSLSLTDKLRY
jgi:hypothetical protein